MNSNRRKQWGWRSQVADAHPTASPTPGMASQKPTLPRPRDGLKQAHTTHGRWRGQLTSNLRSAVAQMLYPELSRRDAGIQVASDIATDPWLRIAMKQAGYRKGVTGYTPQQLEALKEFYS